MPARTAHAGRMNGTTGTSAYESTAGFDVVGAADFGQGAADDLLWLRQSNGASGAGCLTA